VLSLLQQLVDSGAGLTANSLAFIKPLLLPQVRILWLLLQARDMQQQASTTRTLHMVAWFQPYS
jgi:hypothetical protein